ncbi:MAG TPA: EAL domain-containing protein [Falsiroseomonas sp.]|jgi:EAL domain-containing protein (putative c-di-GMP-specific phosphodiesterase class I)|nr:EAL domain-containing protein [Falsiroseomonas sp.]
MLPSSAVDTLVQAADAELMLRRARRGPLDSPGLVLVASDPQVIAAARDASRRLHGPRPIQIVSGAEALHRLVGPGQPPSHLVLQGGAAGAMLLSAARDRFSATEVIVVARPGEAVPAGLRAVPAIGARLAEALAAPRPSPAAPAGDAAALAAGLARGEITVRFQPVVRLADRRPVMVEALARWERPEAVHGAGDFIAMAEAAGLATELTLAVARRALAGLGRQRMLLSFNVPLSALLRPDLPSRLARMVDEAGIEPTAVLLELTESTVVRDTSLLRRALQRLDIAGLGVLLDDLGLDDSRSDLLDLPFRGVKLDRGLIAALPRARRARAQVERLTRDARRRGRLVIAEGVTDPLLWRLTAAMGCDLAQGFGVGRPILPEALPGWTAAWGAAALPQRQPA